MLNVNYKNRIGYCTETQVQPDGTKNKYRIWFCWANCLCALMYFWDEEKDGEILHNAKPVGFFTDNPHFDRCIKAKVLINYSNFHFKVKELNKDQRLWTMVKHLVLSGVKVTLE